MTGRVIMTEEGEKTYHAGMDEALLCFVLPTEEAAWLIHVTDEIISRATSQTDDVSGVWRPRYVLFGTETSLVMGPLGEHGLTLETMLTKMKVKNLVEPMVGLSMVVDLLTSFAAVQEAGCVHTRLEPSCLLIRPSALSGGGPSGLMVLGLEGAVDMIALPEGASLSGVHPTLTLAAPRIVRGEPWMFLADNWAVGMMVQQLVGMEVSKDGRVRMPAGGRGGRAT